MYYIPGRYVMYVCYLIFCSMYVIFILFLQYVCDLKLSHLARHKKLINLFVTVCEMSDVFVFVGDRHEDYFSFSVSDFFFFTLSLIF